MFQKHTTTQATGQIYEKKSESIWYRIWEIENSRYIDVDNYVPYLEWNGTPETIDMDTVQQTAEQKWDIIRFQRNQILRDSDWTQLSDVPLSSADKVLWATYRQSLRDITTQADPDNITWSTTPI